MSTSLRIASIKLLLLLASFPAGAQLEYTLSVRTFDSKGLELTYPNARPRRDSPVLGAQFSTSYLIPLRQINLKAGPEIGFGHYQKSYDNSLRSSYTTLSFGLTTLLYPFDISGNCNCPDFSKRGNGLKKRFFLQFSAGTWMQRNRYDYPKTPTLTSNSHTWLFGGSAGLDLGTSGHLAISPMLLYFRGWENQKTPIAPGGKNEKLVFSQIGAGLRFGFH